MEITYPTIIAPVGSAPLTPEQGAEGHDTVTMVFESPVLLTIKWGMQVAYPKGPHEVPVEWSDHDYLRAHGVRKYARPVSFAETVMSSEKKPAIKK